MPLTRFDTTTIAHWLLRLPLREAAPARAHVAGPQPVQTPDSEPATADAAWLRAVRDYQSAMCDLAANVPGACEAARVRAVELTALDRSYRIGPASDPSGKYRS